MLNKEKRKISHERNNRKKQKQLGMPSGTASHRLYKIVLLNLIQRLKLNICFRCGKKIITVEDLSVDHKISWLDSKNPVKLFFDLDNIAFSHLSCNCSNGRVIKHPSATSYRYGCRCDKCKAFMKEYRKARN